MMKKFLPETILSFKDQILNTNLELDQLFESINSSFLSSTNKNDKYKNIKFISHFKKSTNKWKKSLEEKNISSNDSIKLNVKNSINKLSKDNFDKVTTELIMNLNITDYNSLIILSNEIFNFIIMHPIYMDIYIDLIKKIYYVTQDHWNFEGHNLITTLIDMSQIKYFDDYKTLDDLDDLINVTLMNNMKFIELEGLSDDELMIVNKSMKISNIKFIFNLYDVGFLDKTVFNNILLDLIGLKTKSSIEALIEILNSSEVNNKVILNNINQLNKLTKISNFDFRIKFIYGEALAKFIVNKKVLKKTSNLKKKKNTEDSYKIGCENILEEYIMIQEQDEIFAYLKETNDYNELCKFTEILIKNILCSKDTDFNKLKLLLKTLTNKKFLKISNIKKGFNNNLKNFNDLIIDFPKAEKNLNKFLSFNYKTKLLKKEFVNELLKRYSIEVN